VVDEVAVALEVVEEIREAYHQTASIDLVSRSHEQMIPARQGFSLGHTA